MKTRSAPPKSEASGWRGVVLFFTNTGVTAARALSDALLPYRWLGALAIVGMVPAESAVGVLFRRVAEVDGNTLVTSLLDWPAMMFLLVLTFGTEWIRNYLHSIEEVGGMKRKPPAVEARSVDELPVNEDDNEAS